MFNQNYGLKQQLKISRQQIQLLNFYALNSLEIENLIKTEIEDNPFLDLDIKEEKLDEDNYDDDEDERPADIWEKNGSTLNYTEKPVANQVNYKDDAKLQLHSLDLDEKKLELAEYIIDSLNDRGILDRSIEELAEDYSFQKQVWVDAAELEEAREILKLLEPAGLGARNIRECLMLQLIQIEGSYRAKMAYIIVDKYYDDLIAHKFEKICHSLNLDKDDLKEILAYISKLDFYPVSGQGPTAEQKNTIIPDFIVTNNGVPEAFLSSSKAEQLSVNQSLYEQMKDMSKEKSARVYISNKIQSARWFADALKQREETMLRIIRAIVKFQEEFFSDGNMQKLKPMILKDIAAATGYDLSTVSRITSSRYADTPFGVVFLKDLFGESLTTDEGNAVSNKAMQALIQDIIAGEEKAKPYTDQHIADMLQQQGYKIARRTVTKYREMMDIPIAQIRAMQFAVK